MNNKGADQPGHQSSLIGAFVICCLDSIMPILAKSEISRLASISEQASLSLNWSQPPKTGFLVTWLEAPAMMSVEPLNNSLIPGIPVVPRWNSYMHYQLSWAPVLSQPALIAQTVECQLWMREVVGLNPSSNILKSLASWGAWPYKIEHRWASSWNYGTYHIGDQRRLRWAEPVHPCSLARAFAVRTHKERK